MGICCRLTGEGKVKREKRVMSGKNKIHIWQNRGLIYSIFLGFLTPHLYFPLLDLVASYIEIPFSGYLISNYQFDARITISVVMFSLDTLLAIFVSLVIAFPLGRMGHGSVIWKIIFYISAFYLSIIFQEQDASYLNVLIQLLSIPELSVYVFLSSLSIYFGYKEILHAQKKVESLEKNKLQ